MKKSVFMFGLAVLLNACTNAQTKQTQAEKLSAAEFSEKIKTTENALIVDVRTPEEFEKGHLENALNINWNGNDFDSRISALDKSKPVFVYCLSGGRSAGAVDRMRKSGFENVIEMPGGMMEWRANNLPEIKTGAAAKGMSAEQYQSLLNSDKLMLIDFYADWCAPCKKMKPYLEKIAVEMADKVTLVRINADDNTALCKQLNVTALPVLKLYKNNELVWENTGYTEEAKVREQFKKHQKQ